jgi:hypothetical protein
MTRPDVKGLLDMGLSILQRATRHERRGRFLSFGALGLCCATALFLFTAANALAQTDDFNDNNDVGWTHYDPIGSHPQLPDIATFTVTNGAYRIRTAASPLPSMVGPARGGALRTNVSYTDFYATVDLVDWDETLPQSVGILARVKEPGLGMTDGYVLTYNFRGQDIDITRFTDEDPDGGNLALSGEDNLILEKGKKYRLVFWGKGTELGARVYDLANLDTPLVDCVGTDSTYPSGFCGLLVYDNSSTADMRTDATFDNYFAVTEEPPKLQIVDLGFGLLNIQWPGKAASFKLEATEIFPATTWTPINEMFIEYFADLDKYIYQFDGSVGNQYFRLRKP